MMQDLVMFQRQCAHELHLLWVDNAHTGACRACALTWNRQAAENTSCGLSAKSRTLNESAASPRVCHHGTAMGPWSRAARSTHCTPQHARTCPAHPHARRHTCTVRGTVHARTGDELHTCHACTTALTSGTRNRSSTWMLHGRTSLVLAHTACLRHSLFPHHACTVQFCARVRQVKGACQAHGMHCTHRCWQSLRIMHYYQCTI